jgi:hypothetical protein
MKIQVCSNIQGDIPASSIKLTLHVYFVKFIHILAFEDLYNTETHAK